MNCVVILIGKEVITSIAGTVNVTRFTISVSLCRVHSNLAFVQTLTFYYIQL